MGIYSMSIHLVPPISITDAFISDV